MWGRPSYIAQSVRLRELCIRLALSRDPGLSLCSLGGIGWAGFSREVSGFADAAHYRLHQAIDAFFFWAAHLAKAKFGLALWSFAEADGHLAAQIIFDEGGFVARTPRVPGIDAENREIAQLPFAAARSCD